MGTKREQRALVRERQAAAARPKKRYDGRTETEEQRLLWARCQTLLPAWARALVWASPIGEKFAPATAARLRSVGALEAGVPDLAVMIPNGARHGLFIELKRAKGGVVSPAQRARHAALEGQGYVVLVARGADEAWEWIRDWVVEAEARRL